MCILDDYDWDATFEFVRDGERVRVRGQMATFGVMEGQACFRAEPSHAQVEDIGMVGYCVPLQSISNIWRYKGYGWDTYPADWHEDINGWEEN